jgi:hypothetical protein
MNLDVVLVMEKKAFLFQAQFRAWKPSSLIGTLSEKYTFDTVMRLLTLRKMKKSSIRELNMVGGNQVPAADFIRRNLEGIEKCDVLTVYFLRLSAGTCIFQKKKIRTSAKCPLPICHLRS